MAGVPVGYCVFQTQDDLSKFKIPDGADLFQQLPPLEEGQTLKMVFAEPKKTMYKGTFLNDNIYTSVDDQAWMLLENDSLFYGMLNRDGKREGHGVLYQPNAQERDQN